MNTFIVVFLIISCLIKCIYSEIEINPVLNLAGDEQFGGKFIDNFGNPLNLKLWTPIHDEIEKCIDFEFEYVSDNKQGTLNLFVSSKAYDDFKGIDFVPENKAQYHTEMNGDFFEKHFDFENYHYYGEKPKLLTCTMPSKDPGWTWTVQRFGPMESTGNYNWLQFGYSDVGHFKDILKDNPQGIVIDTHSCVPIEDGTFKRIGNPPIHIHHIHILEDSKDEIVRSRTTFAKYNFSLLAEQHGDYQCLDKDGGLDCLMQSYRDGFGKWFNEPLTLDGEFNDVRAPRSEKLKFWLEVAIRWSTDVTKVNKQASLVALGNPGTLVLGKQLTYIVSYPAPTDQLTLMWYTGKMDSAGTLINSRFHTHCAIFHSSYLIKATPAELGLDNPKFMPKYAYQPLDLSELGYNNIDDMASFLINHLDPKKSQLICRGRVSGVEVNGFLYDRRPQLQCKEWEFKKGDDFTVLTFTKHQGYPTGAQDPKTIPKDIPNHSFWLLYYKDHLTPHSHFDINMYTQTGFMINTNNPPWITDIILMTIYGGTIQASTSRIVRILFVPFSILLLMLLSYLLYKLVNYLIYNINVRFLNVTYNEDVKYTELPTSEKDV